MNHTPGPWATYGHRQRFVQTEDAIIEIAEINRNEDNAEANARLVAAAPCLLEALRMLYDETADYIHLNKLGGMDNQCMKLARAAIAKAVGGE